MSHDVEKFSCPLVEHDILTVADKLSGGGWLVLLLLKRKMTPSLRASMMSIAVFPYDMQKSSTYLCHISMTRACAPKLPRGAYNSLCAVNIRDWTFAYASSTHSARTCSIACNRSRTSSSRLSCRCNASRDPSAGLASTGA